MQTQVTKRMLAILIVLLAASTIVFIYLYAESLASLRRAEQEVASEKVNAQALQFAELFFDKVLRGSKEVSFDDRLALENSVRALNDKEIFDSWQKFTGAKDQAEVQADFYALFRLLLRKIKP